MKIDDLNHQQLGEYIKNAFSEPGPYHIESWDIYQLNFEPTEEMNQKVERILSSFEFGENDDYLVTLRAKRHHIKNFIFNCVREIESNLSEFKDVFTEIKNEHKNIEPENS